MFRQTIAGGGEERATLVDTRTQNFEPAGGLPGRVFIPRGRSDGKHPCAECYDCQWCPDTRCAVCRSSCEGGCRNTAEAAGHHATKR